MGYFYMFAVAAFCAFIVAKFFGDLPGACSNQSEGTASMMLGIKIHCIIKRHIPAFVGFFGVARFTVTYFT